MDFTSAGSPGGNSSDHHVRGVPKVGGHSEASSTPRRPLVPAPTYTGDRRRGRSFDQRHRAGNLDPGARHRRGHAGVLCPDEVHDFLSRGRIDVGRTGIAALGEPERGTNRSRSDVGCCAKS